ncbi:MAG TPA: hypothetical protein VGZ02_17355 [Candidatus Baltobacteraceae bacterium]|jgi:hypothetical protein|nr:hypothetical protein [Candidatus Baltobacteraceae bacterium]
MSVRAMCLAAIAAFLLAACAGGSTPGPLSAVPTGPLAQQRTTGGEAPMPFVELANLDYSNGTITVYHVRNGAAKEFARFTPSGSGAQGLAIDTQGLIYTTITSGQGKPCDTCIAVYAPDGRLVATQSAPILPGAKNAPFLTDVSVDKYDDIYVSDFGQQAVYFYPGLTSIAAPPTIVAQNSPNAASVLAMPNGNRVFVSGGCGFASVRPYTASGFRQYQPGSCFGIGTIALIGAAADDTQDILTPIDGAPGLVSISSPAGGRFFAVPDPLGSISGIALSGDGETAYVADHHNESVYVYARPAKGWLQSGRPKLLQTFTGFKNLDIIAAKP